MIFKKFNGFIGKKAFSVIISTQKQAYISTENLFLISTEIRYSKILISLNIFNGKNLSPKGEKKTALKELSFFSFRVGALKNKQTKMRNEMEPLKPKDTKISLTEKPEEGVPRIAGMLETVAFILRESHKQDAKHNRELDRIAWRLADAGLLLRELIVAEGIEGVVGVHFPTGKGAILPVKQK